MTLLPIFWALPQVFVHFLQRSTLVAQLRLFVKALWTAEMATLTSKNGKKQQRAKGVKDNAKTKLTKSTSNHNQQKPGGTIVWIQRAFGDAVGWQNAYNNLLRYDGFLFLITL